MVAAIGKSYYTLNRAADIVNDTVGSFGVLLADIGGNFINVGQGFGVTLCANMTETPPRR